MINPEETNALEYLENQGLHFSYDHDGNLKATPKELITAELTAFIKTQKTAIIRGLNTRLADYAADRADMARNYAEKMRAIDMKRQGKSKCAICLYWRSTDTSRVLESARYEADIPNSDNWPGNCFVKKPNGESVIASQYCGNFLPLTGLRRNNP